MSERIKVPVELQVDSWLSGVLSMFQHSRRDEPQRLPAAREQPGISWWQVVKRFFKINAEAAPRTRRNADSLGLGVRRQPCNPASETGSRPLVSRARNLTMKVTTDASTTQRLILRYSFACMDYGSVNIAAMQPSDT